MQPTLETISAKKLIGLKLRMSLADNKTGQLWQSFMPRRMEITTNLSSELISMQVYPPGFDFRPATTFEKWAAIEVSDMAMVPDQMEAFVLPEGLYAVFHYKGSSLDNRIFQYIFGEWLPNSDYRLDNRPHFEVLGAKYKNASPDSEEDIWIPVKPK